MLFIEIQRKESVKYCSGLKERIFSEHLPRRQSFVSCTGEAFPAQRQVHQ